MSPITLETLLAERDSLRARLTTAETELNIAVGNLRMAEGEVRDAMSELEVETTRRRAAEARLEALQAERDELDRRMMSATERIAKQSDALRAAEYRVLYSNGSYTRGIFDAQEAVTLASLYRDAVVEGRTCWATLDATRAALACPPQQRGE